MTALLVTYPDLKEKNDAVLSAFVAGRFLDLEAIERRPVCSVRPFSLFRGSRRGYGGIRRVGWVSERVCDGGSISTRVVRSLSSGSNVIPP